MYKIRKKWPKWNDDDIAWLLRMMRSLFADMTSRGGCCSVCAQFVCGGISDVFFWREIWNVSKIYMSVGVYKNQHSPIRRYHIYIKLMNIKDIIMALLTFRTPGGRFETEKAYTLASLLPSKSHSEWGE